MSDLLSVRQAAQRIGIARSTLLCQISNRHEFGAAVGIAATKIGRQFWISARECDRYRREQKGNWARPHQKRQVSRFARREENRR